MAWRRIEERDLLTRLSAGELETIRAAAEAEGRGDPVSDAVANVTDKVRGFISARPGAVMGREGTLPARLVDPAVALLVIDLYGRTAGMLIDINDVRRSSASAAERLLRDTASGAFRVELPDEPQLTEQESGGSSAQLAAPSRPLRRTELGGL